VKRANTTGTTIYNGRTPKAVPESSPANPTTEN
jgi:hypothetical protein